MTDDAISSAIAITYYAALLNFFTQYELPSEADFSPKDLHHTLLQRIVNGSATNRLVMLYDETVTSWAPEVRTVEQLYEHRARGFEAA